MRCRTCDYPLWTIRSRTCPECGAAFAPSEFEFGANAVQYRCPHCDQAYYGTDERGHLVPRAFECVSCGERVDMDEMVLLPTEGVSEEDTTTPVLAWVARPRRWTRGWRTVGAAMGSPSRLMDSVPSESGVGPAMWFYAIVSLMVVLLGGGLLLVGMGMPFAVGARHGGAALGGLAVFLAVVIAVVGGVPLAWAAGAHGLMRLVGGKPRHGFGRTCQGILYTSGVLAPAAVPCVGAYLLVPLGIWWAVVASLAVGHGQGVRGWRGWGSTLAVPLVAGVIAMGLGTYGVMSMFRMSGVSLTRVGMWPVDAGLQSFHQSEGRLPDHGVELLRSGRLTWSDLGVGSSISGPVVLEDPVTGTSWEVMSDAERDALVARMVGDLSAGWAAHRLGHVVFTYNGTGYPTPQDPDLWVAVVWPDPDSGASFRRGRDVAILRAGGWPDVVDQASFAAELADENRRRAALGLAALPHPQDVKTFP